MSNTATTQKPLLQLLQGKPCDTAPIWLMRQAGRYLPEYRKIRSDVTDFLELCYTPELAAEVTLQPIRRFGFDGSILFSDILVIPDALGVPLRYEQGEGPVLEALKTADDIANLATNRITEHLQPVFETISILRKSLPEHVTLIGFAGAPWTVATYMIEGGGSKQFAKVKGFAARDTEIFSKLIDILVAATTEYLKGQIKAGAEVLQLFDSWAGVLSEEQFRRWVIAPTKAIVQNIKAEFPNIPIIGFPKGAAMYMAEYIRETGVDAAGLDYTFPLSKADTICERNFPLQGNLDPTILAASKEQAIASAENILDSFVGKPLIFNLGHGILPNTPIENVEALVETVRNYKASSNETRCA